MMMVANMKNAVYLSRLMRMRMKGKLLPTLVVLVMSGLVVACGGGATGARGELTGVKNRPKWDNPVPYGMVTIPAGTFHMGNNEQDVNYSQNARIRQITISSFHIDDTEISNNEYRQFVDEVVAGSENAFMDSVFSFMERYYGKKINNQEEYLRLVYPDTQVWNRGAGPGPGPGGPHRRTTGGPHHELLQVALRAAGGGEGGPQKGQAHRGQVHEVPGQD
jgi:formylglycine-generating enzyme required for sulfatase activity